MFQVITNSPGPKAQVSLVIGGGLYPYAGFLKRPFYLLPARIVSIHTQQGGDLFLASDSEPDIYESGEAGHKHR